MAFRSSLVCIGKIINNNLIESPNVRGIAVSATQKCKKTSDKKGPPPTGAQKRKVKPIITPPKTEEEVVLGKRVLAAVKKVSMTMGGDPDQIESDLVKKLKSQSFPKKSIGDLVEGMTIDVSKTTREIRPQGVVDVDSSRAERVRRLMESSRRPQGNYDDDRRDLQQDPRRGGRREIRRRPADFQSDSLFTGQPLGIFIGPDAEKVPLKEQPRLTTWEHLEEKEIKLAVSHPPANGFEEMIMWTEKGIMWKYPIDNEQGLDEEVKYSFADHVFLESLIESWCPDKGPLRNFMDIVCVSLAKNSYLTVPEKKEYLEWYGNYFADKASILKETGAGEIKQKQQSI